MAQPPDGNSCLTCRYWIEWEDEGAEFDGLGSCHRSQPMATYQPYFWRPGASHKYDDAKRGVWPVTRETGWCGEYMVAPGGE